MRTATEILEELLKVGGCYIGGNGHALLQLDMNALAITEQDLEEEIEDLEGIMDDMQDTLNAKEEEIKKLEDKIKELEDELKD